MRYLTLVLMLAGCQISIQKLPPPLDPEVAKVLDEHHAVLKVLVDDYNKSLKEKEKK